MLYQPVVSLGDAQEEALGFEVSYLLRVRASLFGAVAPVLRIKESVGHCITRLGATGLSDRASLD